MNFATWSDRSVIADSLRSIGFKQLARKVFQPNANEKLVEQFLNIIVKEATRNNDMDVLDRLYAFGLIKG